MDSIFILFPWVYCKYQRIILCFFLLCSHWGQNKIGVVTFINQLLNRFFLFMFFLLCITGSWQRCLCVQSWSQLYKPQTQLIFSSSEHLKTFYGFYFQPLIKCGFKYACKESVKCKVCVHLPQWAPRFCPICGSNPEGPCSHKQVSAHSSAVRSNSVSHTCKKKKENKWGEPCGWKNTYRCIIFQHKMLLLCLCWEINLKKTKIIMKFCF